MIPHTELLALLEKATPGPWASCTNDDPRRYYVYSESAGGVASVEDVVDPALTKTNAELIAALRTHAAELIANSKRYEWLRSEKEVVHEFLRRAVRDKSLTLELMDAAIDAAIEEEGAK
jgi:Arc/MetJ family transcription regulator